MMGLVFCALWYLVITPEIKENLSMLVTSWFTDRQVIYCPSSEPDLKFRFIEGCLDENGEPITPESEYQKCLTFKDCLSCPDHAYCDSNGQASCLQGFKLQNGFCVENILVKESAKRALTDIEQNLRSILGNHLCYGEPSKYWFDYPFLRQGLLSRFENELNSNKFTVSELESEIIKQLNFENAFPDLRLANFKNQTH